MTAAYRFMRSKDLKFWTDDRTVRLGSLSYYRGLERAGGIGDPNEGIQTRILNYYHNPGFVDSRTDPILSQISRFKVSTSQDIKIQGHAERRFVPHTLILSTSVGNLEELRTKMCYRKPENYDAGIFIPNLEKLAKAIRGGKVEDGSGFSFQVKDVSVGLVAYSGTAVAVTANPISDPTAFIKDRKFDYQKEARIAFTMTSAISEFCNVRVPRLHKLFEVMFTGE